MLPILHWLLHTLVFYCSWETKKSHGKQMRGKCVTLSEEATQAEFLNWESSVKQPETSLPY